MDEPDNRSAWWAEQGLPEGEARDFFVRTPKWERVLVLEKDIWVKKLGDLDGSSLYGLLHRSRFPTSVSTTSNFDSPQASYSSESGVDPALMETHFGVGPSPGSLSAREKSQREESRGKRLTGLDATSARSASEKSPLDELLGIGTSPPSEKADHRAVGGEAGVKSSRDTILADKKKLADAIKQEGNELYQRRQFENAIAKYQEAAKSDPREISYHLNIAAAYLEMGEYNQSITACEKAIEIGLSEGSSKSMIAKAYMRMGNAYCKQEQWAKAVTAYESSLSEDTSRPEIRKKLNDAKKRVGEENKVCIVDLEKALGAKNAGNSLFKDGKFSEAMNQYEISLSFNPKSAAVYSNLAACLGKLGKIDRAIQMADRCIELDPSFVKAYLRKGTFLLFQKKHTEAVKVYSQALGLDGTCHEAKEGLRRAQAELEAMGGREIKEEAKKATGPDATGTVTPPPASPGSRSFSLVELQNIKTAPISGVDRTKLEQYLSDKDFEMVFKMDKAAFAKLKSWRQIELKKDHKLF